MNNILANKIYSPDNRYEISDENNPLRRWFKQYRNKIRTIIDNENLSLHFEAIAEFFLYQNMQQKYPQFCELYKKDKLCHNNLPKEKFCCLFCGCPFYNYDIWDQENNVFGGCNINSTDGFRNENGYWDCSNCSFVHHILWVKSVESIIEQIFQISENIK